MVTYNISDIKGLAVIIDYFTKYPLSTYKSAHISIPEKKHITYILKRHILLIQELLNFYP